MGGRSRSFVHDATLASLRERDREREGLASVCVCVCVCDREFDDSQRFADFTTAASFRNTLV
jgi:hypothetical protein